MLYGIIHALFKGKKMDFTNKTPEEVLKSAFGYDSFRLLQKDIISNVLAGKDTLAIMPTGGGKSLCYQIPALIFEGLTVVVSPLISLMQDQVASLNAAGINAVFLNSTVEWEDYKDSMNSIRRGETKIVYVAPETLVTPKINDLLHDSRVTVSCITIDEAHCVSEWGQDFIPIYSEIPDFIKRLSKRPVIGAFTATATEKVRDDIIHLLGLNNPLILTTARTFSSMCGRKTETRSTKLLTASAVTGMKAESSIAFQSGRSMNSPKNSTGSAIPC